MVRFDGLIIFIPFILSVIALIFTAYIAHRSFYTEESNDYTNISPKVIVNFNLDKLDDKVYKIGDGATLGCCDNKKNDRDNPEKIIIQIQR